ncbi:MAG: hypothetical protein JWM44_3232 [Bacilli bacterium]|nr:hypothetical protein [Bacilli bacterium]
MHTHQPGSSMKNTAGSLKALHQMNPVIQSAPLQNSLSDRALLLSHAHIMQLQKTIGNHGVTQLLKAHSQPLQRSDRASTPVAQLVSKETLDLWNEENNQTVALDSGSHDTEADSVEFNDGDIKVIISDYANNHFSNRHTMQQYSFKESNIKQVNSFWAKGTTQDTVLGSAKTVLGGLEDEIVDSVNKGGGAVVSANNSVAGLTVGYKIGTEVSDEDDAYDEVEGTFTKGSGTMEMFYPEGGDYTYYSKEDLKTIRTELQKPPYSKTLQLKLLEDE